MAKENINFHQTFQPEAEYISMIILNADQISGKTVQEISSITGIPQGKSSGKVAPHLSYAQYMDLIDSNTDTDGKGIALTSLGKQVMLEDPGLQELLTLWLCHALMVSPKSGAPIWKEMFMSVLPKYHGKIKIDMAINELDSIFTSNVSKKNFTPFYKSYSDSGIFGKIAVLEVDSEKNELILNHHQYTTEFDYLYAYVLFKFWDELFNDTLEITANELELMKYRYVFGWSETEEYEVLERLNDLQIIRLNRQLSPFTIVKQISKDELEQKLYTNLI